MTLPGASAAPPQRMGWLPALSKPGTRAADAVSWQVCLPHRDGDKKCATMAEGTLDPYRPAMQLHQLLD